MAYRRRTKSRRRSSGRRRRGSTGRVKMRSRLGKRF